VLSPIEELFEKGFPDYYKLFKDLTNEELITLAESFNFKNSKKRERLENIMSGTEKLNSYFK